MAIALVLAYYGIILATGTDPNQGFAWSQYLAIASFLAVPISVAFGVLKYRLYDIDVVINKAVVYAVLAVFITGVYLTVVVAAGSLTGYASNPVLSGIAAAIVALAFQPVRRGTQRLANRLVYGERATPYEVLAQLGDRLARVRGRRRSRPHRDRPGRGHRRGPGRRVAELGWRTAAGGGLAERSARRSDRRFGGRAHRDRGRNAVVSGAASGRDARRDRCSQASLRSARILSLWPAGLPSGFGGAGRVGSYA